MTKHSCAPCARVSAVYAETLIHTLRIARVLVIAPLTGLLVLTVLVIAIVAGLCHVVTEWLAPSRRQW